MRWRIEAHDLPGRRFVCDGATLGNVHVGVQVGRDPAELVRGDAASARWELDVTAIADREGRLDVRGPAVHGKRGDRFVYLTWGEVTGDGSFEMFRRAKLMVADIDPAVLATAARTDGMLVASVGLTDERGGPVCACVRAPAITWRAG